MAAFSACASIVQAARWAKLSRNAHYNWLKEDPTYPQRFKEAVVAASRALEDEAVRRAREGLRRAVRYKGKVVGYETEYSDTLLLALLKANAPEKFVERSQSQIAARFVDEEGKDRPILGLAAVEAYMNGVPDAPSE